VLAGQFDAAVSFPADFAQRLTEYRQALRKLAKQIPANRPKDPEAMPPLPKPQIIYTTANERSQIAFARLSMVLENWAEEVGKTTLAAGGVPESAIRPFSVDTNDVAAATAYHGAAIWSKILPVLLLVWAMTGAFYPAVDLCAGEKERGTLETLLSSPAERSEIVLGKLLTIMLFSGLTSALNIVSVGITGCMLFGRFQQFSGPPPLAVLWLAIALVPVAALFSALCLALAAFARSTKEGQYYLMPLLLVTLPLAIMPMAPGVELNLGNSLIPITGIVLLLKTVLEGSYLLAMQYLPVVLAVTLTACWLAVRWAVDQFNSESVLFRESERFDVMLWLRHLARDRQPTPTVAGAVFCGVLILMLKFFMSTALPKEDGFGYIVQVMLVTQLAVIATPAMLMAIMLTSSPPQTLLLKRPRLLTLPAAVALAVAVHPLMITMSWVIQKLYPVPEELKHALDGLQSMFATADRWQLLLIFALLPAVCEELAFRGFILSGFRHLGHKWRAIAFSALFFGIAHGFLQQSISACLLGVVLGYLAVQSGSILPGILFHVTHNTLAMVTGWITPEMLERWPAMHLVVRSAGGESGPVYHWPVYVVGGLVAVSLLAYFSRLPTSRTTEETLQEAIDHAAEGPAECCA
jgi:sodium transport system permease protein